MADLWFKRSCGLSQDPDMQAVMLDHGPVAMAVFEELMALTKIKRGGGSICTTYTLLGQRLMMKTRDVQPIVAALDRHGLVVLSDTSDAAVLVATFPTWAKWNPKDPTAGERQSRRRHGSVTANTVTVTAPEVEKEKEKREPPLPPKGSRARERVRYEEEVADYAVWLLPDAPEPERGQIVIAALSWVRSRDNVAYTTANVLLWLRRYAPELVTEENAA